MASRRTSIIITEQMDENIKLITREYNCTMTEAIAKSLGYYSQYATREGLYNQAFMFLGRAKIANTKLLDLLETNQTDKAINYINSITSATNDPYVTLEGTKLINMIKRYE